MKFDKYIITGTAGFIGGFLSKKLKKDGAQVIEVDVAPRDNKILQHLYPKELVDSIINSPSDFDNSVLLHVGADSNANAKTLNELQIKNIDLTETLVNRCNQSGIPALFISSAAVYGNSQNGEINFKKSSPYAQSKLIGEQIVTRSGQHYGVGNLILRLFNCYGEDESNKGTMMSVPSRFVYDAIKLKKIEIWDVFGYSKFQARDFIYVGDLVKMISFIVSDLSFDNQTIDAGSGTTVDFMKIARLINSRVDCEISRIPTPDHVNLENYQLETRSNMTWLLDSRAKLEFSNIEDNLEKIIQRII